MTRYYYTLTADTIWRTGYENPTTFVQYTHPEAVLRLPLHYGDTLTTAFAANGEYGHRIPMILSGTNTAVVDAEGKLILPDKTYEQVLRVHSQRQYTESGLDSTAMLVDKYQWFAAGVLLGIGIYTAADLIVGVTTGISITERIDKPILEW